MKKNTFSISLYYYRELYIMWLKSIIITCIGRIKKQPVRCHPGTAEVCLPGERLINNVVYSNPFCY